MMTARRQELKRRRRESVNQPQEPKWTLLLVFLLFHAGVLAQIPCQSDEDCRAALGPMPGAVCHYNDDNGTGDNNTNSDNSTSTTTPQTGTCANPFHHGGCLANLLPHDRPLRVCHSDDPPASWGVHCRPSPLHYPEVRILALGWESALFGAWILQILLTELLHVPASIETGGYALVDDFYDHQARLDYSWTDVQTTLQRAYDVDGDCAMARQQQRHEGNDNHNEQSTDSDEMSSDTYLPCAHVSPEVWEADLPLYRLLVDSGAVEQPTGLGALVEQGTYVPLFVLDQYPELGTFVGMRGQKNRHKLAEIFKTPTSWADYCALVSPNNCTEPDDVAARAPQIGDQDDAMFVHGLYTGHFRHLPEQNCTLYPDTCFGSFIDYPCSWASHVRQYTHWLNISLQSTGPDPAGGYSYSQLVQIWDAANWTKSPVIMEWANSELNYQTYLGTDAEFTQVTLPPPTQECIDSRSEYRNRCEPDPDGMDHVGSPLGACGNPPVTLYKAMSTVLKKWENDPSVPLELRSPAREAIMNYKLSSLHIGRIFNTWNNLNVDKWGIDPRRATCQWVVDNFELVSSFVPDSQPRAIQDVTPRDQQAALYYTALVIACLALLLSVATAVVTYLLRDSKSLRFAQVEFLFWVIGGLFFIAVGSVVSVVRPTDKICVAIVWLINLGFTFELVPLIVKVAAINRLMLATQQMRQQRIRIQKSSMYGVVVLSAAVISGFLVVWTLVDPPHRAYELSLTDVVNENGETIVERCSSCQFGDDVWVLLSLSWRIILLLSASVLAFQNRKLHQGFNEARGLSLMVYSQFIFVILRTFLVLLEGGMDVITKSFVLSITNSCDVVATLGIYFLPRFVDARKRVVSGHLDSKRAEPQRRFEVDEEATPSSAGRQESSGFPTPVRPVHFEKSNEEEEGDQDGAIVPFIVHPDRKERNEREGNEDDGEEDDNVPRVPFLEVNPGVADWKRPVVSDITETHLDGDVEEEIVFETENSDERFSEPGASGPFNAKRPVRIPSTSELSDTVSSGVASKTPFMGSGNSRILSSSNRARRFPSIAEDSELQDFPAMDQTFFDASSSTASNPTKNAKVPRRKADEDDDTVDRNPSDGQGSKEVEPSAASTAAPGMLCDESADGKIRENETNSAQSDEGQICSLSENARQPVRIPSKNRDIIENEAGDGGQTIEIDEDEDGVTVEPPTTMQTSPFLVPPPSISRNSNAKIPTRVPSVKEGGAYAVNSEDNPPPSNPTPIGGGLFGSPGKHCKSSNAKIPCRVPSIADRGAVTNDVTTDSTEEDSATQPASGTEAGGFVGSETPAAGLFSNARRPDRFPSTAEQ